jgi:hypothetical protein
LQLYADSTAAKLHPAKKTAELEFTDKNIWWNLRDKISKAIYFSKRFLFFLLNIYSPS